MSDNERLDVSEDKREDDERIEVALNHLQKMDLDRLAIILPYFHKATTNGRK